MRGPSGSSSPAPRPLFKIPKVCQVCGRAEDNTMRMQTCQSCRAISYCGRECQKKDWPTHKSMCKTSQVYNKQVQEVHGDKGALGFRRLTKWITFVTPGLMGMVAYLLDKKTFTHVIVLRTEHLDTKPYFRIQTYKVQSVVDMARENPAQHLQMASGLQEMRKEFQSRTSSDGELFYGLVLVTSTNDAKLPEPILVLGGSIDDLPLPLRTPDTISPAPSDTAVYPLPSTLRGGTIRLPLPVSVEEKSSPLASSDAKACQSLEDKTAHLASSDTKACESAEDKTAPLASSDPKAFEHAENKTAPLASSDPKACESAEDKTAPLASSVPKACESAEDKTAPLASSDPKACEAPRTRQPPAYSDPRPVVTQARQPPCDSDPKAC
eukprot:gene18484-24980_t